MYRMRVPDIISKEWHSQANDYMVFTLGPELEAALDEQARRCGAAGAVLVLDALRELFLAPGAAVRPLDEWERRLLGLAKNCGVSLSNAVLSREARHE